ncbi:MAG: ribosome maturation factor RimP [Oscillospiraceae bacterium]|nr:ribosome maturation factor RimP [Oscillospiraceae bacterium]
MAKKTSPAEALFEAAEPIARELGLKLWDTLFVKEGSSWHLRAVIDKDGGVSIDDCEKLSRALDPIVDALDTGDREFCFEVSSPGLGRELRSKRHIDAYVGRDIKIKLYRALEGKRELNGVLAAFDGETLTLESGESLKLADCAKLSADDDY